MSEYPRDDVYRKVQACDIVKNWDWDDRYPFDWEILSRESYMDVKMRLEIAICLLDRNPEEPHFCRSFKELKHWCKMNKYEQYYILLLHRDTYCCEGGPCFRNKPFASRFRNSPLVKGEEDQENERQMKTRAVRFVGKRLLKRYGPALKKRLGGCSLYGSYPREVYDWHN